MRLAIILADDDPDFLRMNASPGLSELNAQFLENSCYHLTNRTNTGWNVE